MNEQKNHVHVWKINGLDCPNCALELENAVKSRQGVKTAELDFLAATLRITCSLNSGCDAILEGLSEEHGVVFQPLEDLKTSGETIENPKIKFAPAPRETAVMIICGVLIFLGRFMNSNVFLAAAAAVGAYPLLNKARGEILRKTLGMNVLMLIAASGAGALGEWMEGAMVLFLYAVAQWLERMTGEKARLSIEAMQKTLPKLVALITDSNVERTVPAAQVQVGSKIRIRPGETIPMDGINLEGASNVDESTMTGESTPVGKKVGDELLAGTRNLDGTMIMNVTAPAAESRFSRIMVSVQKAQAQKTALQSKIDKFASIYTPLVITIAIALAVLPPFWGIWPWAKSIYSALVLLVIACPCALVLASPITLVAAMTAAAKAGVLLKSGSVLEETAKVKVLALDKTGTITKGEPEIENLYPTNEITADELLKTAAALEIASEHPFASAFKKRINDSSIELPKVEAFKAIAGHGIVGRIASETYRLGDPDWALENCPREEKQKLPKSLNRYATLVVLSNEKKLLGSIALADTIRPEAKEALKLCKKSGIKHIALISGDRPQTVCAYAEELDIDSAEGGLTPELKSERIAAFSEKYGPVMMVGDGVNDAPALAVAAVGIAMGKRGTDAALETAGAVILHDNILCLPILLKIAHKADFIVRTNIAVAIGLKLLVVMLSLLGAAQLWMAVLADTGASLIVVLNGLRALAATPPENNL